MDENPVEQAWQRYKKMAYPNLHLSHHPKEKLDEAMRQVREAFFSGAAAVFFQLLYEISDGDEPSADDEQMMSAMHDELEEFSAYMGEKYLAARKPKI